MHFVMSKQKLSQASWAGQHGSIASKYYKLWRRSVDVNKKLQTKLDNRASTNKRYTQFLVEIHFINPFINAAIDVKPLGGRVGHLIFHAIFWSNSLTWGSKYQSNVIKFPIVGHINWGERLKSRLSQSSTCALPQDTIWCSIPREMVSIKFQRVGKQKSIKCPTYARPPPP